MKFNLFFLFLFLTNFCFSQQKKVIDFRDINNVNGVTYFGNGEKVDGEIHKRRTFGPYYESLEKTFWFKDGILIGEISYFTDIKENIVDKKTFYYYNSTQISKMIIFHDKKHNKFKTYEFYENGKRKSIETVDNGNVKYHKAFENK